MYEESEFKNISCDSESAKQINDGHVSRWQVRAPCVAVLAIAMTFCGAGLAHGQNQKNKKDKDAQNGAAAASLLSDNQTIDLLVSQMLGAWQAGDVEGMHKFYADDVTVISGGWEPPLLGWANYARAYQAQLARASGSRLERTNSYIKVLGDSAWVTYQWQYAGTVDGKTVLAFGHTTLVLEKRAGAWLIALNHTSAIPTDQPSIETSSAPASGDTTSSLAPSSK